MKCPLWLVSLACCASAAPTSNQRVNDEKPKMERAETRYPFGGFLFTGSADALQGLGRYGEGLGLKFSTYPNSPTQPALLLSGDVAFDKMEAVIDLVNKSQSGKFGAVRLGLISEVPSH